MVFDTGLRAQGMIGGRALHTETGLSPIETTSRNRPITRTTNQKLVGHGHFIYVCECPSNS